MNSPIKGNDIGSTQTSNGMQKPDGIEKTALSITRWVGSPGSIIFHTVLFIGSFLAAYEGYVEFDRMLLVLTTIVSLEAIYLAIFIQMTINYQAETIAEVEQDIDEIQEDIDEIQEDVEEMSEEEESEEELEERRKSEQKQMLASITGDLHKLIEDVEHLKKTNASKDTKPLL